MRVFLDTNVLVSAFATRGLCADVVRLALSHHQLVVGKIVLEELNEVLRRKFGMPEAIVRDIDNFLAEQEIIAKPDALNESELSDDLPALDEPDASILRSALAAKVDVLVTGDQDLLEPGLRFDLEIGTPRELWERAKHRA